MRRLVLVLSLVTLVVLMLAPAAEARSCGRAHISIFHGRVYANRHTSCALARRVMRVFVLGRRSSAWVLSPLTHKRYRFRLFREEGGLGSGYYVEARARGARGTTLSAAFRALRRG
jgi:hypothetical protein